MAFFCPGIFAAKIRQKILPETKADLSDSHDVLVFWKICIFAISIKSKLVVLKLFTKGVSKICCKQTKKWNVQFLKYFYVIIIKKE